MICSEIFSSLFIFTSFCMDTCKYLFQLSKEECRSEQHLVLIFAMYKAQLSENEDRSIVPPIVLWY